MPKSSVLSIDMTPYPKTSPLAQSLAELLQKHTSPPPAHIVASRGTPFAREFWLDVSHRPNIPSHYLASADTGIMEVLMGDPLNIYPVNAQTNVPSVAAVPLNIEALSGPPTRLHFLYAALAGSSLYRKDGLRTLRKKVPAYDQFFRALKAGRLQVNDPAELVRLLPRDTQWRTRFLSQYTHWTPEIIRRLMTEVLPTGYLDKPLLDNPSLSLECKETIFSIIVKRDVALHHTTTLAALASTLPHRSPAIRELVLRSAETLVAPKHRSYYQITLSRRLLTAWTPVFGAEDWAALNANTRLHNTLLGVPGAPKAYLSTWLKTTQAQTDHPFIQQSALANPAILELCPELVQELTPQSLVTIRDKVDPAIQRAIDTRLVSTLPGIRLLAKHGITPLVPVDTKKVAKILASSAVVNKNVRTKMFASLGSMTRRPPSP